MTVSANFQQMLADDVAQVFMNTAEFAEPVTLYPLGVVANAVPLTAIFSNENESPLVTGPADERTTDFGHLFLSDARAISEKDTFLVRGKVWKVHGDAGGTLKMLRVPIQRVSKKTIRQAAKRG